MFSLKDISTLGLKAWNQIGEKINLFEMGIRDADQLEKAVNNGEIKSFSTIEFLRRCHLLVARFERDTAHLEFDRFETYANSEFDQEKLLQVDMFTPAYVLMLENIFWGEDQGYRRIRTFNVDLVKHLASHTDDRNGILIERYYRFGKAHSLDLVPAINYYDAQVIRQAKEVAGDIPQDLFYINQDERKEIVRENIRDYLRFLFNRSNHFVFGSLTDRQIDMLVSTTKEQHIKRARESIINDIALYSTMSELDVDGVPELSLSRFIL